VDLEGWGEECWQNDESWRNELSIRVILQIKAFNKRLCGLNDLLAIHFRHLVVKDHDLDRAKRQSSWVAHTLANSFFKAFLYECKGLLAILEENSAFHAVKPLQLLLQNLLVDQLVFSDYYFVLKSLSLPWSFDLLLPHFREHWLEFTFLHMVLSASPESSGVLVWGLLLLYHTQAHLKNKLRAIWVFRRISQISAQLRCKLLANW
jgi:hypothetical protein